jgi:hypothetical protein
MTPAQRRLLSPAALARLDAKRAARQADAQARKQAEEAELQAEEREDREAMASGAT